MTEYSVTWTTDIEAKSPEIAAKRARNMQLNPRSTATVYEVTATGNTDEVDLEEVDLEEKLPHWGSRIHTSEFADIIARELTDPELIELQVSLLRSLRARLSKGDD